MPKSVLQDLRNATGANEDEMPEDSLLTSEVDLGGTDEEGLIVMGIDRLRLPHAALFWVFKKDRTGYTMVLSTGGDSLSIIPSRTNGYNRICLSNNTAATYTFATYAFDGKQYKLEKTETKPIQQLDEAQQPHTLTREQTHFDLEGNVNVPIKMPSQVLATLSQDRTVLASRCERDKESPDQFPAQLFEVSAIQLDGPNEIDLLVKAKDGCLFGANIGPFWIFRNTVNGYSNVLEVHALGLDILPERTQGIRNIRAGAVVSGKPAAITFKFDGRNYRRADSH